ncbi:hypothetical protein [Ensifer sp. LC163]|uniref:hypothetical protein n=1 Tax=Ensifer sp. LC163 TaxID=1120652 RepID=UPI0008136471|nr:hypothetical protein [Ensifer sp. LC163]OCP36740.1 hypothetical protein BC360_05130 [Ensifer sp. LC163]
MADPNKPATTSPTSPDTDRPETSGVPIRLLYDVWAEDEQRVPAGTELLVPVKIAKDLIEAGKAERADPLPGDFA